MNKPISECVRLACDSMLTINLLQVVNGLVASFEEQTFNLLSLGKIFVDVSNGTEAHDGGSSYAEYLAKLATWLPRHT